jgi:tetratricopeptide (TPR) repeat protein
MLQACILAAFACVLYVQTIYFDEFVADDNMVISANRFVQQGIAGIPDILTHDSFYGFDTQLNRQNTRKTYRPLSLVMFAVEKSLFNSNQRMAHVVHIALYALTVVALWRMLRRLLPESRGFPAILPYAAALLFAAHPIHTEVVANIKSRDELLALSFIVLSLNWLLRYVSSQKTAELGIATGFYALALLSKENAVTFVPVFPLALFICTDLKPAQILRSTAPLVVVAVAYVVLWFGVFGQVQEALYERVTNNPFVAASTADALATKTAIMGLYILKALYPTTLSTGYTYNQIPIMSWLDWRPLLALCAVLGLLVLAIMLLRKRHLLSLCVLGFFCTMAIASNYVVYAGGLLGERFLYTPSLLSCLAVAWILLSLANVFAKKGEETSSSATSSTLAQVGMIVLLGLQAAYTLRTLYRNNDWKSTETLLKADTEATPNSVLLRQMYGGLLVQNANREESQSRRLAMLEAAREQFVAALAIDSTSLPALYNGLGNYFNQTERYDSAVVYLTKAITLDERLGGKRSALYRKNLAAAFVDKALKDYQRGDKEAGLQGFLRAVEQDSTNDFAFSNVGIIYVAQGRTSDAVPYLQHALTLNPQLAKARKALEKAEQLATPLSMPQARDSVRARK